MRFNLPRQNIIHGFNGVISKEVKRQKIHVIRATKKNLKEMAEVSRVIKKRGLPKSLVRYKLKDNLGYGIFLHPTAAPIRKGQVIAPYAGRVSLVPQNAFYTSDYVFTIIGDILLSREEQKNYDRKSPYHPRRLYSLDLDALVEGNFTRFINHSAKPNVEALLIKVPANDLGIPTSTVEIVYFAKKDILPGQQLLVSYEDGEKTYWGAMGIKPAPITPKTFSLTKFGSLLKNGS